MKKTLFVLVALAGAFLTGCQQDTLTPQDSTDFSSVELSAARFSVEADSTTKMKCKGKLTELATADIPSAITAYIATNYDGSEVKFAGTDEAGNVVVGLTLADGSHVGLLFDSAGNFKEELKHYAKHAKLTEVDVATLPAAVTDYIAANYAGAEIKRAGTNEAGELFVMAVQDSKPLVLVFNADGSFSKVMDKPMKRGGKMHGPGHK